MKQKPAFFHYRREYQGRFGFSEDIIDVKTVDWNRVWQVQRARKGSAKRNVRFWDNRASSFAKAATETEYANSFLSIMNPRSYWTVLDMGCGSGTLAIPLSKRVSSVTAVDFSSKMLSSVLTRCEAEGIGNVKIIHGSWEDDWERIGIGTHDVAIASRSMVADDLRSSIQKLNAVARKQVYIVTVAGDGPFDRRLFDAIRRPLKLGPDYICNYNMLYQMGIFANVVFIKETRRRTYNNPEEASASVKWMFDELNAQEEEKLTAYFRDHLVFTPTSGKLSYDQTVCWAVIWWNKDQF